MKHLILTKAIQHFCPTEFISNEFLSYLNNRKNLKVRDFFITSINKTSSKTKFSPLRKKMLCISKDNLLKIYKLHTDYNKKHPTYASREKQLKVLAYIKKFYDNFDKLDDSFFYIEDNIEENK